ncbi:MAG: hypothetical protein U9Q85_03000 [Patescibacteria group bacterium]|nr:hypothetical protein [Patescibacteria group bacterium]
MKKINIKQFKKYILPVSFFVVVFFVFFNYYAIAAGTTLKDTVLNTLTISVASPILIPLGILASILTIAIGALDTLVISAITYIVGYNNFIAEGAIINAWVIVRDLCNMFFVIIFLVIAFASILRYENYSIQKTLPKLLIMAVLINFSRMICGLFIDISQVIMLTFVDSWGANGAGFVEVSKMTKFFTSTTFDGFTTADWDIKNVVAAYIIGLGFLLVIGVVLVATLGVFLMRMILLWVYVIFSPVAFVLSAFPAGHTYASKWISGFTQQLIVGPVLAFFIWLAMIIGQTTVFKFKASDANVCTSLTDITCITNFLPFILSIGVMMAGLMAAQSAGGMAGGAASWGVSKIKQGKSWGIKQAKTRAKEKGVRYTGYAAKGVGSLVGINADKDSTRGKVSRFMGSAGSNVVKKQNDTKATKRINALKKFGLDDTNIESLGKAADSKIGRAIGGVIDPLANFGMMKNWVDKKKKDRDDRIDQKSESRKSEVEKLKVKRDDDLKINDLMKEDQSERIKKSETWKDDETEKARKTKDDNIKSYKEKKAEDKGNEKYYDDLIDKEDVKFSDRKKDLERYHNNIVKTKDGMKPISADKHREKEEKIENNYYEKEKLESEKFSKAKEDIKKEETRFQKIAQELQPNRIMVEAGKKAGKDTETAGKRLDVIQKGENPLKMSPSTYSSPSGMTNVQTRFFDKLTNSTDGSRKAIENMTKTMEKYANRELQMGDKEHNAVRSLKQGLAGYSKAGNSIEALSGLKDLLNKINNHKDSNHPDAKKTVEDYESTVISS